MELGRYGIGQVVDLALQHLTDSGVRSLHLSYDINAMDPSIASATFTKVSPPAWVEYGLVSRWFVGL